MSPPSAPEGAALLSMRGVHKAFGATRALVGADLDLGRGEVLALIGENGAGKSTLMKALAGALLPDGGSMTLEGRPYRPAGPLEARRAGVAMIYQELNIAPHLTVAENILLGTEPHTAGWLHRRAPRERVVAALAHLKRPDIHPDAPAGSLPPAARQLVEIARALVQDARVIVMDEPTSSLGAADIEHLFTVIEGLCAAGIGVVYISHFLEEVLRVADRYAVLRDGALVETGAVAGVTVDHLVTTMMGRRLDEMFPRVPRERGDPLLELDGLGGEPLPSGVDLTVHRGEIVGIAGLVGSGRTELLRTIFGLDPVRSGRVRVGGGAIPRPTPRELLRRGVGLASEDRKEEGLALSRSIAENTTLSRLDGLTSRGLIRRGAERTAVRRWVERLAVRCEGPDQPVESLSGGNQQKVALARLLHHDVDLLLLDEPTRGIDVGSKAEIYRLIGALAAGEGEQPPKGVVVVSSSNPELLGVCDRIGVMHRGLLGPLRPAEEWSEHALTVAAVGGKE